MTTVFVSDLHLDRARPEVTESFIRFLERSTGEIDALYILGDLFEVWFGDDDPSPDHAAVAAALRKFSADGTPCYLIHGNRDFLIGTEFVSACNLRLIDEQTTIEIGGNHVLLMHGDELCTDDASYQRFRRIVRSPLVQRLFRLLPLATRRAIADRLRQSSIETDKPEAITDVNADAVAAAMRDANVRILIHGHTHRPAIHQLRVDNEPALRIVLGDWYTQGSVLNWTASGPELTTLQFK